MPSASAQPKPPPDRLFAGAAFVLILFGGFGGSVSAALCCSYLCAGWPPDARTAFYSAWAMVLQAEPSALFNKLSVGVDFTPLWGWAGNYIFGTIVLSAITWLTVAVYVACRALRAPEPVQHRSGVLVLDPTPENRKRFRRALRKVDPASDGIEIAPGIRISRAHETQHAILIAQTLSGKSQTLWFLLRQILARQDRVFIYDFKGEFVPRLPKNTFILCPSDARSLVWHVARDVRTRPAARALAAALIKESRDPMWSAAARQLLTAMVIKLQTERGTDWGWADLAALTPSKFDALQEMVTRFLPEAAPAVEEMSKTLQSVRINLSAYMSNVTDLAEAEQSAFAIESGRRISLLNWIAGNDSRTKLILRHDGTCLDLSVALANAVMRTLLTAISSPTLAESDHRIWFILDEFLQLGKLEPLPNLIETARSKGIRLVLTTQSLQRFRSIYSKDADGLLDAVGTIWISRTIGPSAADLETLIGPETVERYSPSTSYNAGGLNSTVSGHQTSWITETRPAFSAARFAALGKRGDGPSATFRALLKAGVVDPADEQTTLIPIFEWPVSILDFPQVREPYLPAQWILPKSTAPQPTSDSAAPAAGEREADAVTTTQPALDSADPGQARIRSTRQPSPSLQPRTYDEQPTPEPETNAAQLDQAEREMATSVAVDKIAPALGLIVEVGADLLETATAQPAGPTQPQTSQTPALPPWAAARPNPTDQDQDQEDED